MSEDIKDPLAYDEEGLDLADAVDLRIKALTYKMAICCVGVVRKYDPATQKATVQPVVRARFKGRAKRYPPIPNIPVIFEAGGGFSNTMPLKAGDFATLIFSDRSLDEWETVGGEDVTASDTRRYNLTDALCIPGVRPFSKPLKRAFADAAWFGQDEGDTPRGLKVTTTGKVLLGDEDGADVVTLLHDVVELLQTINFGGFVADPVSQAKLTAVKTLLADLKV